MCFFFFSLFLLPLVSSRRLGYYIYIKEYQCPSNMERRPICVYHKRVIYPHDIKKKIKKN